MIIIKNTNKNNEIAYQTKKSAGFDIRANEGHLLGPGEIKAIATGLFLEENHPNSTELYELQIRPRSGLSLKGITVANSPGCVDEDFLNCEIKVILVNHSQNPFKIEIGDRIAQGIVTNVYRAGGDVITKDDIRTGGFGSTNEVKP